MDNIPSLDQCVIDELVELWHTGQLPPDLAAHITKMFGAWGASQGAKFLWQVYKDLKVGERTKYTASSPSEFQRFLAAEYRRSSQTYAMSQEESRPYVSTFVEVAKAPIWAEPVELRPKSKKYEKPYEKPCWNCGSHISSAAANQKRCRECGWFICSECGSCKPHCIMTPVSVVHDEAVDLYLPDFPDE